MVDVQWIKLSVKMFEDEKIRLVEAMPEADTILVIWVKLLAQAGKTNADGCIYLTENIAFTDEMLATVFNRPLATVRLALQTLKQLGMIEIYDDHVINICNWNKHQNIDGLDKIREQNRLRKQKEREKRKLSLPKPEEKSRDRHVTVTQDHATEKEIDIELEEEIEKEKDVEKKKPNSRKRVYDDTSIHFQLASFFYEQILTNNPDHKQPNLNNWANDVRLMMERDNRTPEQIKYLMDWVQRDSFWQPNVLSVAKLREKFDQLVAQVKAKKQDKPKKPSYPKEEDLYAGDIRKDSNEDGHVRLFK